MGSAETHGRGPWCSKTSSGIVRNSSGRLSTSWSKVTAVVGAVLPPPDEDAAAAFWPLYGHSAFQCPFWLQRRHVEDMIRSWRVFLGRFCHGGGLLPLPPLDPNPLPLPPENGRLGKKTTVPESLSQAVSCLLICGQSHRQLRIFLDGVLGC